MASTASCVQKTKISYRLGGNAANWSRPIVLQEAETEPIGHKRKVNSVSPEKGYICYFEKWQWKREKSCVQQEGRSRRAGEKFWHVTVSKWPWIRKLFSHILSLCTGPLGEWSAPTGWVLSQPKSDAGFLHTAHCACCLFLACLTLQPWRGRHVFLQNTDGSFWQHGITLQNTALFTVTAARTSNPARKIKTEWMVTHMGDLEANIEFWLGNLKRRGQLGDRRIHGEFYWNGSWRN
jgi:hypothetical protein